MSITEFILARVAEDEQRAHYAMTRDPLGDHDTDGWWLGHYQHYTRHSPERVLADCEAKRRIVEQFDGWDGLVYDGWTQAASLVLSEFAAIWADHEDYDEGWSA